MREKVVALMNSPYDVTMMIDTDVWPYTRRSVVDAVASMTSHHHFLATVDTWAPSDEVPNIGQVNGGFLISKRSNETHKFLTDVVDMLDNHPVLHEQAAYNLLIRHHPDLNFRFLHHTWSCRNEHVWNAHCLFLHSHAVHSCPLST